MKFIPTLFLLFASIALATPSRAEDAPPTEADYYTITPIPTPGDAILEVGGIDFGPDGKIYVCTRHGEIWTAENAFSYPDKEVQWTLFAQYLHEPLGIAWKDGWLYATQRPELTRMKDEDGDGRADVFETISDGWGISGNYHEYAFGTRHDKEGNIWVVTCLTGSFTAEALFRGWVLRISPEGKLIPTACGVRSPGGIGFGPHNEVFYTDNQGAWNGSSSLKHVKIGSFQGNPNGNVFFPFTDGAIGDPPPLPPFDTKSRTVIERENIPTYVPPAIMFPHQKLGQSPTGIALDDSGGKFGPFAGQLFVGEQTHSQIQRCFLEEVNGVYQGAVFPFLSGFQSGNIGVRLSPDGALFTGGSNRGWGARGGKPYNFERVTWNGKTPFEVHEMRAQPDGFQLTFTQPVDPDTAVDASFDMTAYTYNYGKDYGSPQVDEVQPTVSVKEIASDGKSITLTIDTLTKGHVHELHLKGLRNKNGHPLVHDVGYYTLNEIPE
jgi:sugar lactone lactonase YvrE